MIWNDANVSINVHTVLVWRTQATGHTVQGLFLRLRPRLFLSAAGLLLLGIVVHSLQKQKHLEVDGLREQIHSHGSNRTERGPVNSVGWRSAQTTWRIWTQDSAF